MPRLLAFLPCEKFIVSQEENAASFITILQGFTLASVAPSDPSAISTLLTAEGAALPVTWYVVSLWEARAEDEGIRFEQRVDLFGPPPKRKTMASASAELPFAPGKLFHRAVARIIGFPLDGIGEYTLVLSLKVGDGDFTEVGRFPIPVTAPEKDQEGATTAPIVPR